MPLHCPPTLQRRALLASLTATLAVPALLARRPR
jgi:hypothetical protein